MPTAEDYVIELANFFGYNYEITDNPAAKYVLTQDDIVLKYKSAEELLQDWLLTMTGNSYDYAHYWDDILTDAILNYGCKLDGLEAIQQANVKPLWKANNFPAVFESPSDAYIVKEKLDKRGVDLSNILSCYFKVEANTDVLYEIGKKTNFGEVLIGNGYAETVIQTAEMLSQMVSETAICPQKVIITPEEKTSKVKRTRLINEAGEPSPYTIPYPEIQIVATVPFSDNSCMTMDLTENCISNITVLEGKSGRTIVYRNDMLAAAPLSKIARTAVDYLAAHNEDISRITEASHNTPEASGKKKSPAERTDD
jgi:hypothetical protein